MSENKHTPEFYLVTSIPNGEDRDRKTYIVREGHGCGICKDKRTIIRTRDESLARLIAKTPELLRQCRRLLTIIESDKKLRKTFAPAIRITREVLKDLSYEI